MSRRKRKKWHQQQQQQAAHSTAINSVPPLQPLHRPPQQSLPPVDSLTFENMEDKIRGEEVLLIQEEKKNREARDVKKKLDDAEVDRRLEALRRQLGLK